MFARPYSSDAKQKKPKLSLLSFINQSRGKRQTSLSDSYCKNKLQQKRKSQKAHKEIDTLNEFRSINGKQVQFPVNYRLKNCKLSLQSKSEQKSKHSLSLPRLDTKSPFSRNNPQKLLKKSEHRNKTMVTPFVKNIVKTESSSKKLQKKNILRCYEQLRVKYNELKLDYLQIKGSQHEKIITESQTTVKSGDTVSSHETNTPEQVVIGKNQYFSETKSRTSIHIQSSSLLQKREDLAGECRPQRSKQKRDFSTQAHTGKYGNTICSKQLQETIVAHSNSQIGRQQAQQYLLTRINDAESVITEQQKEVEYFRNECSLLENQLHFAFTTIKDMKAQIAHINLSRAIIANGQFETTKEPTSDQNLKQSQIFEQNYYLTPIKRVDTL